MHKLLAYDDVCNTKGSQGLQQSCSLLHIIRILEFWLYCFRPNEFKRFVGFRVNYDGIHICGMSRNRKNVEFKLFVIAHTHKKIGEGLMHIPYNSCLSCDRYGILGNAREIFYHYHESYMIAHRCG